MLARNVVYLMALAGVLLVPRVAQAESEENTVQSATTVLNDLFATPVRAIPDSLLAEAHGVAVIPNLVKVGFVVGGQRGHGVLVVKERDGNWRAPAFITLTGGSVGFQIGAQSTDIVLVFKTQRSVDGLLKGKFTIGADAAAAAGPVGRRVGAATDAQLKAEIYSYSRSRGLFAGISLDGSALQVDGQANAAYYGAAGQGQAAPPSAQRLVQLVAQYATPPAAAAVQPVMNPQPVPAAPAPRVGADAGRLKQELARAAIQLSGKTDDAWRRYLALPAEVYRDGSQPPLSMLQASLSRFDTVASDARYRPLAQQQEFQVTRDLLRAYVAALSAQAQPQLNLPPPPAGAPR